VIAETGISRAAPSTDTLWRSESGIPVRNLWVLLAYAADLAEFRDRFDAEPDEPAELPDVLARLLVTVVERRLRRNLSRAYQPRRATLARLRGRIDWLETLTGMHLQRGRVACRFEDLTFDTPRNRLVRVALEAMAARIADREKAAECRRLARDLTLFGVAPIRPSTTEMSRDPIASHQSDDRLMVAVARLALDLVLPSESPGSARVTRLERDEAVLRYIFEKAVAGFYRHEFHGQDGWRVRSQSPIDWGAEAATKGAAALLPGMIPDLILEHKSDRRIVLDTKFTNVLTARPYGGESFKSANLYQIYAYLRSQAGHGDQLRNNAEGILLYPSLDRDLDESVIIQGHRIRFVTVNLALKASMILERLRSLLLAPGPAGT
jgi:5-methylcytosine-specific restriction enzyme subunit McrC